MSIRGMVTIMLAATTDPTALLAELEQITPQPGAKTCHTQYALDRLADTAPEVAAAVAAIIDRPDIPAASICQVLTRHGFDLSVPSLARHRRRGQSNGCRCPRSSEDTPS